MAKQTLNPYLNFRDTARPAMEFYKSIFGGELTMNTFAEYGQAGPHPGSENLIMHSQLETPAGFTLMASDTPPEMQQFKEGGKVSISLSGDDETALTGYCGATIWVRPMLTAPGTWAVKGKTVRPSWSATDSLLSLPFPVRGSRGTL